MSPSFFCRWDWCRCTFPTYKGLADHVVGEHIEQAQPVPRQDIELLRRVESANGAIGARHVVRSTLFH